jgi:adenylate cyclase
MFSQQFKKVFLKNLPSICLGLFSTFVIASFFSLGSNIALEVNSLIYDMILRGNLKKLPPINQENIAIIAIDDKSIANIGRWPWSRQTMAKLLENLHKNSAAVVAFDIVFSEPERNIVEDLMTQLPQDKQNIKSSLQNLLPKFNYDEIFSKELANGENVMSFVFNSMNASLIGVLPEPLLVTNPQVLPDIKDMKGFLSNIKQIGQATHFGGFINSTAEFDGVIREAPMLSSFNGNLYPSLALAATMKYLMVDKIELVTEVKNNKHELRGIKLDNLFIPITKYGGVLIPYRALPYSFNYFSAVDVLNNKVPEEYISGRLVFIGATATGLGDLQSTPVSSAYPGTEINASIASAILDKYFPAKLPYSLQLQMFLVILFGVSLSFIFPFCSAIILGSVFVGAVVLWTIIVNVLWLKYSIVITLFSPLFIILLLAFMNMVNSYLLTNTQKKEIKSAFGQYVPQQHIDNILQSSSESLLSGDTRELTILFSDIRGFTTLSEKMTATELKAQLNEYLTEMTKVIFENDGTIDKYVGDMIMAFWNAPLYEENHAFKAVRSSLFMQKQLRLINEYFKSKNLPEIGIGVGINTGVVNIGDMGSKYRRAYTAIGDEVNLASRLEGMCRIYDVGVIVGENTYQASKDKFVYLHLDKVQVKGKKVVVNIYEPMALIEDKTPEMQKEIKLHDDAMNCYYHQDWESAKQKLTKLIEIYPNRGAYKLFLTRTENYAENPPGLDWNGVFVAKEK